jgi:hypothetical protein
MLLLNIISGLLQGYFWSFYTNLEPSQKKYYEIIKEGKIIVNVFIKPRLKAI